MWRMEVVWQIARLGRIRESKTWRITITVWGVKRVVWTVRIITPVCSVRRGSISLMGCVWLSVPFCTTPTPPASAASPARPTASPAWTRPTAKNASTPTSTTTSATPRAPPAHTFSTPNNAKTASPPATNAKANSPAPPVSQATFTTTHIVSPSVRKACGTTLIMIPARRPVWATSMRPSLCAMWRAVAGNWWRWVGIVWRTVPRATMCPNPRAASPAPATRRSATTCS